MKHAFRFLAILSIFSTFSAMAAGAAHPENCFIGVDEVNVPDLVSDYVPRGANGRSSAGAVYRTGPDGEVLQVIYEKNALSAQAVASTQKILTAFTAYQEGKLGTKVTFTNSDLFYDDQGNRALHRGTRDVVDVGEAISVLDYMGTMINQSSNGAAFAISRGTAGSTRSFMKFVNAQAKRILGPNAKSYFQNPSGLTDTSSTYRFAETDARQQSTANELSRIAGHIMGDSGFRKTLEDAGVSGAKSGYLLKFGLTQAAGKTVVVTFPLPSRCGNQRISFAFFGSLADDQFADFRTLYEKLRERILDNVL